MNSLELRYLIFKALDGSATDDVTMISPKPGGTVSLELKSWDPATKEYRVYRIDINEK